MKSLEKNRREFMRLAALEIGGVLFMNELHLPSAFAQKKKRPNIIFLMADQLRYQSCGYAGDKKAVTPNIDRMATEGINFRQAVSSMPVCAAYRASLFTGKYVTSTGMVINELRMNPNQRCLGHVLKDSGYNSGYIGKWHLYSNQLGKHNDPECSFVPPGKHRLGFDGFWAAYNFHHEYYRTYYHKDTPEKIFHGENIYEPDAQTDMAIEYIAKHKADGSPFSMVVSYGTPHDPWDKKSVPEKYSNMFKDVKFSLPPNYSSAKDPYGDEWSNIDCDPEKLDEWMRIYYAMTANLDWNVGRIIDAVDRMGLAEDTIIVFTSDHGEMFGAHGRMKKNIFYDEAARVPMLVRCKGKIPAGSVSDCCFNTPDIMPTLLGLLGLGKSIPKEVEGMDLSHLVRGQSGPEPEAAYLFNTGACAIWEDGHEWRAVRDKKYTYAVYRGGGKNDLPRKELFFDNIKDSYQTENLVGDAKQKRKIQRFRKLLKKKMQKLNDTFPASTWYQGKWTDGNRNIISGAKGSFMSMG
jgi:arylsulfatase A-like enzyme